MAYDKAGTSKSAEDSEEVQNSSNGYFAIIPLVSCPHLDQVQNIPSAEINAFEKCSACASEDENWLCLTCYKVNCGRYINAHAADHFETDRHSMALSMADLSVWCYVCESYVHNEKLLPMKNAAHKSKFGEPLPKSE